MGLVGAVAMGLQIPDVVLQGCLESGTPAPPGKHGLTQTTLWTC